MEASVVPEKIYVHELSAPQLTEKLPFHIEYTKTDTLIEKAQLFLIDKLKEIPMGNGKMKIKADSSLEDFIEDFVNYMKGE